jgi:hypothetical protein
LPYSSVGPTLGGAADLKFRFTPTQSRWHLAVIAGGAVSYLRVSGQDRAAWSPGADLVVSRSLTDALVAALNARYVFAGIPTAPGGTAANHVHAIGGSAALKIGLTETVSIIPEIGVFRFEGAIGGSTADGWGSQYGAVLSALVK